MAITGEKKNKKINTYAYTYTLPAVYVNAYASRYIMCIYLRKFFSTDIPVFGTPILDIYSYYLLYTYLYT
jgi:hypothetical protein